MATEESKTSVHMEVDNHSSSCFPTDSNSNGGIHPPEHNSVPYYENNQNSQAPPELKQETTEPTTNGHHIAPSMENSPAKVTSQLREMLQNPGVPKDTSRCNNNSNANSPSSPHHQPVTAVVPPTVISNDTLKTEDTCYKFKNNIKHRFNADLRYQTSSPTDSHFSDRMSLPDEDNNNNKLHMSETSPLRPCLPVGGVEDRLKHNGGPPVLCSSNSHAFSPYQPPPHVVSELTVKIPERTAPSENGILSSSYGTQHWDSHAETASSCGSNPSPPPNTARSTGSSSGYSTNGENNSGPTKIKAHSPALSPYSRTPDRLSNRSPSPVHLSNNPEGVPIFALHPSKTYYIPLTIEPSFVLPYMISADDLPPVLSPVSICVNFSGRAVKIEKLNNGPGLHTYRPQSNFIMDRFHDRYVNGYSEKPMFYTGGPISPSKIDVHSKLS